MDREPVGADPNGKPYYMTGLDEDSGLRYYVDESGEKYYVGAGPFGARVDHTMKFYKDMPMDRFKLPDGRILRVTGDNILVERLPMPELSRGGIIYANRSKEDATAIGIIRAVGHLYSKEDGSEIPLDLEPGLMCAFLWFYAERHTNLQIQQRLGENIIFLKWTDITLVWPPTETHNISDIVSMGA